jgi:2-polyprenyl-3-methyl-5-hydroxy-6-metoxy-1,4-benzoquinol methylase
MAEHPEADIYRCSVCTHAFSDPSSMRKQESYDAAYYNDTHGRWFEHPNTALFDRLAAISSKGGSVLDVGCGRGDHLRYLHRKRPDLKLTGIDYSPNQDGSIRFLRGDVLNLDIHDRFEVVNSLAVIEHVANCVAFARRLRDLTKLRGIVAIMTLNESSILYGLARAARRMGITLAFNRLYSCHHLHHFTRASLGRLLESCGLKVRQHIMHNAPVKAMDIPVLHPAADAVLRAGVWAVFEAGLVTSRTYLQTVICSV